MAQTQQARYTCTLKAYLSSTGKFPSCFRLLLRTKEIRGRSFGHVLRKKEPLIYFFFTFVMAPYIGTGDNGGVDNLLKFFFFRFSSYYVVPTYFFHPRGEGKVCGTIGLKSLGINSRLATDLGQG